MENPFNLPDMCYGMLPTTGETIVITFGETGYKTTKDQAYASISADYLNQKIGVTKAQRHAMEVGSMFGWDVPGCNPALYEGVEGL